MIGRHILGKLLIKILKADCKLGNHFIRFLCNSIEIMEQFSLRYLAVEKFEELITDVLKRSKFPEIVVGIPLCNRSIERQSELHDFRGVSLYDSESLS